MKKIITSILVAVLLSTALFGCSKKAEETENKETKKELSIVTTIFPQYDFAKQIVGDNAELTMLLKPGAESHSYEPTPADIKKIQNCDVFICAGGENEVWVDTILESFDSDSITVIRMLDCVDAVEEEHVEGMQSEHEHEEGEEHEHEEEEEHQEEIEYDEHVWTSPKNAIKIVKTITDAISSIDEKHKEEYKANSEAYIKQLESLDQEFKDAISQAKRTDLVVGDRFPFRYLVEEYGLTYRAAFPGCSTDTEVSAETMAYLMDYVKENQIPVVFTIEFSNGKVADAICEETGAKKLQLHSCHNVSKDDFESGITYIDLMENNVANLKEALQ